MKIAELIASYRFLDYKTVRTIKAANNMDTIEGNMFYSKAVVHVPREDATGK